MELKLGLMTPEEMAAWFGIKRRYYQNNRKTKLLELAEYCDFEDIPRKGILVKEIFIPEYIRSGKQVVEKHTEQIWKVGEFNTPNNVAKQVQSIEEVNTHSSEKNTLKCVKAWKMKNYGCSKYGKESPGMKGSSESQTVHVAIANDGTKIYTPLTPEEKGIRIELYKKYFKTNNEWFIERMVSVKEEYEAMQKEEDYDEKIGEEWYKTAQAAVAEQVMELSGLNDDAKWAAFKAESLKRIGPTERAIMLKPGIFFECEENAEYYLAKQREKYEF